MEHYSRRRQLDLGRTHSEFACKECVDGQRPCFVVVDRVWHSLPLPKQALPFGDGHTQDEKDKWIASPPNITTDAHRDFAGVYDQA